jgi:ketosteroid isomerase-like protein
MTPTLRGPRANGALALPLALALGAALALSGPAAAGPAADVAQHRIAAIAAGEVAALTAGYADGATLEWVGGPLDGSYRGPAAIAPIWTRFAAAQGPLQARVGDVVESANPRGQTVIADVVFGGRATLKVRYVLVLRDGRVVNEVWQIAPGLPG